MYDNIDEWLQNLTSARHSWPLSSEGSFACHTFCDTGHPIILVISEDPWKFLLKVWLWSCNYLYLRLRSVASMLVKNKCKIANDLTSSRNFQHYNSHLLIIIIHPSKLLHKINNKHCKARNVSRSHKFMSKIMNCCQGFKSISIIIVFFIYSSSLKTSI